jgi:hypothetical protein
MRNLPLSLCIGPNFYLIGRLFVVDLRYRDHEELVRKVLLHLHSAYTGNYWSNQTGAVKTVSGHFQRYGLVGSSDIIGHTGQGRAVYIEIKTKSGKLSKDQVKFQSMVLKSNCIHIVAREDFMTDPQFSVMEIRNYGN